MCASDIRLLERVELQVTKMLCPCNMIGSHLSLLLKYLDLPTLAWRRRQRRLELLLKLLHGQGPPDLVSQLPALQQNRVSAAKYSLRRPCSITQLRPRTVHEATSWLCQATTKWNQLPEAAQSANKLAKTNFMQLCCTGFSKDKFSFGLV